MEPGVSSSSGDVPPMARGHRAWVEAPFPGLERRPPSFPEGSTPEGVPA